MIRVEEQLYTKVRKMENLNLDSPNIELSLQIKGMDCASCVNTIENAGRQLAGVTTCELSFASQKMSVTGDVSQDLVIKRVRELGYEIEDPQSDQDIVGSETSFKSFLKYMWSQRETRLALLGALLILP